MLKQIIGALVILAGVGFIFNSCSQDEPTFEDPCPRDTCDKLGIEDPDIDTSGNDDTSNPSADVVNVGLKVFRKTSGGDKQYLTGNTFQVQILEFGTENLIVEDFPVDPDDPEGRAIECLDTFPKVYVPANPNEGYFKGQQQYKVKLKDTISFDGKDYYGESNVTVLEPQDCEWYSPEFQIEEVQ